mmetsp:Transcript_1102/g.3779  ORF Transcript_1102/g.3779 Transcript_1102/m.3779 type:complete len:96 (+) Transcript_1102:22-309(+)
MSGWWLHESSLSSESMRDIGDVIDEVVIRCLAQANCKGMHNSCRSDHSSKKVGQRNTPSSCTNDIHLAQSHSVLENQSATLKLLHFRVRELHNPL